MDAPSKQDFSFGAPFSTTNALQTFMSTRGRDAKRLRVTASPYFASKKRKLESDEPPTPVPLPKTPARPSAQLPTPSLHVPNSPRSFFVSPQLLQHRDLARLIEHLYPDAELIERGPLAPLPTTHPIPSSPPPEEADLLLSPGTGLLCTNLQMIKQRSLPGQPSISPIQARIRGIYERYERLMILVSEGRAGGGSSEQQDATNTSLDERDCLALASLQGFVASLPDSDVQVIYVAGGEMELAKWVVDLMIRVQGAAIKLPHEENQWESFLRRAGLNPFAAQAILLDISRSSSMAGSSPSSALGGIYRDKEGNMTSTPLSKFLRMSHAQRIERFASMLGGTRLLTRFAREEIRNGLRAR
ncbi:MAG: 10 kDa heat shock protein [Watsoniomyces obsoletus]|nr:MAG: 10 kDa heat shock protein [Watsoniomyces obsoletus]